MTDKHTPFLLPLAKGFGDGNWDIEHRESLVSGVAGITDETGEMVAAALCLDYSGRDARRRDYIILAVNAHDGLVEALDKILRRAKGVAGDTDEDRKRDLLHIEHIARMALAAIDRAGAP